VILGFLVFLLPLLPQPRVRGPLVVLAAIVGVVLLTFGLWGVALEFGA
jgi:hypothetical protein